MVLPLAADHRHVDNIIVIKIISTILLPLLLLLPLYYYHYHYHYHHHHHNIVTVQFAIWSFKIA